MGAAFPPCVAPIMCPRRPCPRSELPIASRRRAATANRAGRPEAGAGQSGRQPCSCGSGRRYRNCHGAADPALTALNPRPFAGLPSEPEWVALREIVPAATVEVRARGDGGSARDVTVATVLPMAWPAMVRLDGAVFVGLQVPARSGDVSRDLAAALVEALASPPGSTIAVPVPGTDAPRLQDLLTDDPLAVQLHEGFDFWLDGAGEVGDDVRASMERANSAVVPTARLAAVPAAYWCRMPARNHLRWVLPYDEEPALDALARAFVAEGLTLGPDSRYVGSFRAHGLLVPVWDLGATVEADDLEAPVAALATRLEESVNSGTPLTEEEQRARRALSGRQVTIR